MPRITRKPVLAGVKLGSKWSVAYADPLGPNPVVDLTCIRKIKSEMVGSNVAYHFGKKAARFYNAIFPLRQGAPRDDDECKLETSKDLLRRFSQWFLHKIPEDSGVVFSLPAIKAKEGLGELQAVLRKLPIGKIGMEFFGEAYTAAVGTLPIRDILEKQVLSLNFGSSTVEVVFYSGTTHIHQNVFTQGGDEIDKAMMNAIEQAYRGKICTENQARIIKEQYSYTENNDVFAELTREGAIDEGYIDGGIIREIVDFNIELTTRKVRRFLREAQMKNERAVSSLQADGAGNIVLCGGMVNMPGFADALYASLTKYGGISKKIGLAVPKNGVVAPAVGARRIAEILDEKRVQQKVSTWNLIE